MNQVKQELNLLPEDEQAEIIRRRLICAECPFNSVNATKEGYVTSRLDAHCTLCGCTITRKTASLSSNCGIKCCNADGHEECTCKKPALLKFNIETKTNLELKWTEFKNQKDEQQTKNSD